MRFMKATKKTSLLLETIRQWFILARFIMCSVVHNLYIFIYLFIYLFINRKTFTKWIFLQSNHSMLKLSQGKYWYFEIFIYNNMI